MLRADVRGAFRTGEPDVLERGRASGATAVFRHFYRPAAGKIAKPMVPFFEPAGTGDGYAVAITDPDLIYQQPLAEGLSGSVTMPVGIPEAGPVRILARVRGMSALERSSYTTGWPVTGEAGRGSFTIRIDGKQAGPIPVEGFRGAGSRSMRHRSAGRGRHRTGGCHARRRDCDRQSSRDQRPGISCRAAGARCRRSWRRFRRGCASLPFAPEDEPASLRHAQGAATACEVGLGPRGRAAGRVALQRVPLATRKRSRRKRRRSWAVRPRPCSTMSVEAGRTVYYRVRAVDAWGNRSPASPVLAVPQGEQQRAGERNP